jgi:hypothetical protein
MSRPEILGWESYPETLPSAKTDQFAYDLEEYNHTLSTDSNLLFVPRDEDTFLQVTEIGSAGDLTVRPTQKLPILKTLTEQQLDGLQVP